MRLMLLSMAAMLLVGSALILAAQSRTPAASSGNETPRDVIPALGRIEGATCETRLKPELAGCVAEVLVVEGQVVEEGDVLLRLDDRQCRQEVAVAEAELSVAEAQLQRLRNGASQQERAEAGALYRERTAQLQQAQLLWKRISALDEARMVSPETVDDQRTRVAELAATAEAAKARSAWVAAEARRDDVRIAEAQVRIAKAKLESAEVQLRHTRLCAPKHGQVLAIDPEVGEWIGPESTEPAVVLADTGQFQVRAFVDESSVPRLRLGLDAAITAESLPGQRLHGRIVRLSPRVERKQLWSDHPAESCDTKTCQVWIQLPQGESLVVGLRVDVSIDPRSAPIADALERTRGGDCPSVQPSSPLLMAERLASLSQ